MERQIIYYEAHETARKARKHGHRTKLDGFLNTSSYRKSQTAIGWDKELCARFDPIAAEDHSYIATTAERSRNENSWKLVRTLWINETITKKLKEVKRDSMRSMERATPESIPKIKFDNDEVNILLGPKKVLSVSTPKRFGGGTTIHQQALHLQWQAASWWKSSSLTERYFSTDSRKVFRLQAMAIPV